MVALSRGRRAVSETPAYPSATPARHRGRGIGLCPSAASCHPAAEALRAPDPLSDNVLALGAEEGVAEGGGEPGRLEQRQSVGGEAHLREKALW